MLRCSAGPATPEQEEQLTLLQEALRQVEAQQMELKKSVDQITQKKQKEEVERVMSVKEKTKQVGHDWAGLTSELNQPVGKSRIAELF